MKNEMMFIKSWVDPGPHPKCPVCGVYVWRTPTREYGNDHVKMENDYAAECCGCERIFIFRYTSGFNKIENHRVSVMLVSEYDEKAEAVPI